MNKSKAKSSRPSPHSNSGNGNVYPSRNPPLGKTKSEKDFPYEGIYKNIRFCETITSLMGNTVQIQLSDGKIVEGIFSTFSPQLEVVLKLVHTVDPNHPDKIDTTTVSSEVVFGPQLIVTMSSKDVELDYGAKDSFAIDSAISRHNGIIGEKELQPWVADSSEEVDLSLDNANGWDPNEMFARNEKVYGVQSNFEQDLSQYTTKLEKKDSKEYKELEAKASKLANIIENSATSKAQNELENVSDEEEKFSAVIRPNPERERHESRDFRDFRDRQERGNLGGGGGGGGGGGTSSNSSSGKYIHPNKRTNKGGQPLGKMMRSTPPPHGHGGHPNLAPRHQSGSYHGANYDGDNRGSHSSHGSPGPSHHGYHGQQGGSQHQAFQPSQGRNSSGSYYSHGQNRNQGQSSYGSKMASSQQSEPRLNGEERKQNRDSPYDSKNNHTPHQHSTQPQPSQRDHGHKEQRKVFQNKNREEQNSDLKKFQQDFRLAETAPAEEKKPTPASSPSVPTSSAAPAPAATPPSVTQPVSVASSPVVSPVVQQASVSTPTAPSPLSSTKEATPTEEKVTEPVDKVTETLKKSNLNPNAKEFVLNPNARVFVPRTPGTQTPPRSHTPQTPQSGIIIQGSMGALAPVGPGLTGTASPGQGLSIVPLVSYVPSGGGLQNQGPAGAQGQPHFQRTGNNFRKPVQMSVSHRPELASPMHVAAATGQPLMAPAPIPGPQFIYPSHGTIIPGTPQPYPQVYTMRVVAPQMSMVPNTGFGESPSSGQGQMYISPSPGQGGNTQGPMAPPQQHQHHHPNSAPSPAQHSMAQTPTGNPQQQLIYQTAGGHHGHTPGPPHNHPHASFPPMVFLPSSHTQIPPGVTGPSVPGGPQGVQLLPLGSSSTGMTAMGMAIPQIHYIPAPGPGGQPSHMQPLVPHNQ